MGWLLIVVGSIVVYVMVLGLLTGFPLVKAMATFLVTGIMMILAGALVVSERNNNKHRFM